MENTMEVFRIRFYYRLSLLLYCIIPAAVMALPIAFIEIFSSNMTGYSPSVMYIITIAVLIWLCLDIWKVVKVSSFRVVISDEFIRVGKVEKKWTEIISAEYLPVTGMMKPVILLHDGEDLKIPAAMDGLPYIRASVEKHIKIVNPKVNAKGV